MGKTKRESNYELLRIVAMTLIIVYHVFFHCINNQLLNKNLFERGQYFNNPFIYRRLAIAEIATTFGKIGDSLFVMLSGYFLIDKSIDVRKPIKKLLGEMLFATVVLTVVSFFYVGNTKGKYGITFRYFNSGWWFVGYYIMIILIARFILSRYMDRMGQKEHGAAILILFSIVSIKYMRRMFGDVSEVIPIIITGFAMYLIGGYIKLYNPLKKLKTVYLIIVIVLVNILMYLSYYIDVKTQVNDLGDSYYQKLYSYEEYALVCLILAICLFELFRRIKLPSSKVINYIASATFMVYLIHDNPCCRNLFYEVDWIKMLYEQDYGMLFLMLAVVVLIAFAVGIIAHFIYGVIAKLLKKMIGSQIEL